MNEIIKKPDSPLARAAIFRLEHHLSTLPQEGVETTHRFAPGVYIREMFVYAGVMLTGAIHKTEHISIFLEGNMIVTDGEGKGVEIEAPRVELAQPGTKRAGYALTDVRWLTVHPTELTDIDELEGLLFTNDFSEVSEMVAPEYRDNLIGEDK